MTQRKHAFVRFALPSFLSVALICSSNGRSAPVDQTNPILGNTPSKDTTLYPALSDSFYHLPPAPVAPEIQLAPQVGQYVQAYISKNGYWLQKIKDRSATHFRIIEKVFKKHDLPLQLKYLAVVESKLQAASLSRRGAAGPWQLMPQTARELGLKVEGSIDERTHYSKSSAAAAKYLKRLYAQFDDWLLVLAAYNGGPGTVYKAIRLSGSRNFWKLQNHLPAETRAHVKHFIAVHYFFEGEGSETVLTKAEREAYQQQWLAYIQITETAEDSNAIRLASLSPVEETSAAKK